MTEYRLKEKAAIGAATAKADGATLVEETGIALVAMTTRNGKSRAMTTAFKKHFSCPPPGPTDAITADAVTVMASALDQVFVTAAMPLASLLDDLTAAFGKTATLTDQSDGWARLVLTGPRAPETLERLSMVDLSPSGFDTGQVARTVFEHLNVIVLRDKPKRGETYRYVILTPRSSAEDLHHALLASPPFRG